MKVLADKNIPYIYKLFSLYNQINICDGRMISSDSLEDIDVLLVRSVTKIDQMLLRDNYIKFIGTVTSGVDHIDQIYLKKCGINFSYAPGNNAIAVVEYIIASLLWLAKRDHFFLRDKVVGIVGIGHIGNLLYQRLCSFGVSTLLCDPPLLEKGTDKKLKSLETLVSESDILTIHVPLTYEGDCSTWHMINSDILEALPSNSILINTSRGSVIDNVALLKILQNGKKLSIILDVWESEPMLSLPLLSYVNIGTPHIAGYTFDSKVRGVFQIYNAYCNYFNFINKFNIFSLLSVATSRFKIKKRIDETILRRLVQSVYNVYYDDYSFRRIAFIPGGFDKFRECYFSRREWSSICVQTFVDSDVEVLLNLGFTVY